MVVREERKEGEETDQRYSRRSFLSGPKFARMRVSSLGGLSS